MLASAETMTAEDAIAIANDTYLEGEGPWRRALLAAYEARGEDYRHLDDAISLLRAWDGCADKESVGMTLFHAWWLALGPQRDGVPPGTLNGNQPLAGDAARAMLAAFGEACQELRDRHGGCLEIPWGEVYRARRGSESWPIDGVAGDAGLVTLRAVSGGEPGEGVSHIEAGQSCTTVVLLEAGNVRSYSVVPYGQSEDPSSAHYTDQGRLLFSEKRLKDTWFSRARLDGHIESREALTW
jgi:acyl-homoserine-lactone acylase